MPRKKKIKRADELTDKITDSQLIFEKLLNEKGYTFRRFINNPPTAIDKGVYVCLVEKNRNTFIAKFGVCEYQDDVDYEEKIFNQQLLEEITTADVAKIKNIKDRIIDKSKKIAENSYFQGKKEHAALSSLYSSNYIAKVNGDFFDELYEIKDNGDVIKFSIFGFIMSEYRCDFIKINDDADRNLHFTNTVERWKKEYFNPLIAYVGYCVSSALCPLHKKGKIHHDIKLQNILNTNEDFTKNRFLLSDFNSVTTKSEIHSQTVGLANVGTPAYIPPESDYLSKLLEPMSKEELYNYIRNPDFAETPPPNKFEYDIFMLGMSLYYLAGGKSTYDNERKDGKFGFESWAKNGMLDIKPDHRLDNELWEIIRKMTAYNPEDRYHGAEDLVSAFQSVLDRIDYSWLYKKDSENKKTLDLFSTIKKLTKNDVLKDVAGKEANFSTKNDNSVTKKQGDNKKIIHLNSEAYLKQKQILVVALLVLVIMGIIAAIVIMVVGNKPINHDAQIKSNNGSSISKVNITDESQSEYCVGSAQKNLKNEEEKDKTPDANELSTAQISKEDQNNEYSDSNIKNEQDAYIYAESKSSEETKLNQKHLDSLSVLLKGNGGGFSVPSNPIIVQYGETIDLPVPDRQGDLYGEYYRFDGWFDQKNGGKKYSSSTPITSDTTLYAHWTGLYRVYLFEQPKYGIPTVSGDGYYEPGETVTVSCLPAAGIKFKYWICADGSLPEYYYYDQTFSFVMPYNNVQLNAYGQR